MVLPGWNVSEPIELAHKLYEVVEALINAPESAKAFVSKIKNFSANLKELQRILESDIASRTDQDLEHLRTTILECQDCVKRCEEYGDGFGKLTREGRGRLDGAGQAARWTLQEKKVARLREEIDGQMNSIGLTLAIKAFGDGRTRPSSFCTSQGTSPPRTGTFTPLPPYSSPQPTWTQTEGRQHAKTPSDLLGLDINHTRKTSDTDILNFHLDTSGTDGKESFISPQVSPNALCPLTEQVALSGLDPKGDEKPLELRRNTLDEVTMSPNGLGISSAFSESSSRPVSQVLTSPTISSRRTSTTGITSSASRRDSVLSLNSAILEMIMENLNGVQASYYKAKCRISYPISMIESFRNNKTGHRYIVVSPPASSNIKLFFVPPTDRIIPHSEHPQAYGSSTKHRIKFIEPYLLRSQKTSSDRQPSDASSALSPSLTPVSSAASVVSSSLGSPILTNNSGVLKEESRRQEYDFENIEDYHRFQELLMGPNVKLQFQVPTQTITAKKYGDSKAFKESQLQYLRLWQCNGRQTLMFFSNLSANKYREYATENFRPVESRSKTTIRLDVHLPGMVRRRSGSKSPLAIAQSSTQEQTRLGGDIDGDDMTRLDYLSIEFGSAKDRTAFLRKANFHGTGEEPIVSPLQ